MFGGRRFLATLACLGAVLATTAGACGDDSGDDAQRATVTTAATTTTEAPTTTTEAPPEFEALPADPALTPEEQVEAAYLHSWEVLLDALSTGRTDFLEVAFADRGLELATQNVERLTSDGNRVEGPPAHDIRGIVVEDDAATLIDEYTNHLTLIDGESGEPIEADPNEIVLRQYDLQLKGGTWYVVGIVS